jgi:PAS domain S-box-containing protein
MSTTNVIDIAESGTRRPMTTAARHPAHACPSHTVQFYEDDDFLAASAGRFLAEGIAAAEPALIVARPQTFERLRRHLEAQAIDVDLALGSGRLSFLDADATLSRIMYRGVPERERFNKVICAELDRLSTSHGDRSTSFIVYGEMVDILCRRHDVPNALRVEEFWNDLSSKYSFAALCAYSMDHFQTADAPSSFHGVCNSHTHVLVTNEEGEPTDLQGARLDIARLQQRARALATEVEYRKQMEHELRQNKRQLEDFCENAPEGIHRIAADGTILWANKAELELLGWSRDEYIGHHIAEFHADEHLIGDILARLSRGEALSEHEARLRCKDGSTKHVVINANVVHERDGFIHTWFTRDITARKHAEDSLRFIAEAGAVLAGSLDYESTLNTVCRMCVPRVADWAAVELQVDGSIRRVALANTDPEKVALAHDLWQRAPTRIDQPHGVAEVLRTGKAEIMNEIPDELLERAIPDPAARDAIRCFGLRSMMTVPLLDGNAPIGALILYNAESGRTFDRRDLPLAEELARRASVAIQNARLYKDAQTATRLKDEFLATISHELRTPLTAILGWARMLRAGNVGPENLDRALDSIERNSIAQVQLVEDLLDVSRIISGKLRLDVQSLDLVPVVEGAIESMQQAMAAKNIRFFHVIDPNAEPISGDPHRIQQVIWNLLSNAVKFTPKGGSVRLIVERVDSSIQMTVSDTGQGIPPSILSSIFQRFKQADGNTARVHGGLGLGLAIVRHIVELHGGTVEAQSEGEGRGATFVVQLPVSQQRTDDVGPFRHRRKDSRPLIERPKELQGLTVLVVDDEPDTREILAEVLQQCGCSVLTASCAEDALAVLDRASPRVAVCDIGMPGLDGYEFIERVRKRPADKGGRIVAVALTAFAGTEDRRRALRAGYQMHVAKPVEPAEFVAVLANLAQLAIAMS